MGYASIGTAGEKTKKKKTSYEGLQRNQIQKTSSYVVFTALGTAAILPILSMSRRHPQVSSNLLYCYH